MPNLVMGAPHISDAGAGGANGALIVLIYVIWLWWDTHGNKIKKGTTKIWDSLWICITYFVLFLIVWSFVVAIPILLISFIWEGIYDWVNNYVIIKPIGSIISAYIVFKWVKHRQSVDSDLERRKGEE